MRIHKILYAQLETQQLDYGYEEIVYCRTSLFGFKVLLVVETIRCLLICGRVDWKSRVELNYSDMKMFFGAEKKKKTEENGNQIQYQPIIYFDRFHRINIVMLL